MTRTYRKRQIPENIDTSDDISTSNKKKAIDEYCKKKLASEPYTMYDKFYFTSAKNYVQLLEYHPYWHSTNVNRSLEGINHKRIQREALDEIKKGLTQLRRINADFDKTYRQELLDSPELYDFILSILEEQEYERIHDITRYPFALNLFYILMKILVESVPSPIASYMIKSMKDFFDMANLPVQLGMKDVVSLVRPEINETVMRDGSILYSIRPRTGTKRTKKKSKT